MKLPIALSSCLGTVALLALAWWCLSDKARLEPAAGTVPQDVELPVPGPAGDQLMAATQASDSPDESSAVLDDGDSPAQQAFVEEEPHEGPDSTFMQRWDELQTMAGKNPFSLEWWRWRLGFERTVAEDDLKAHAGQGARAEKARLDYARALDRIAIVCLLDQQGRYRLCESEESTAGTEGDKFVSHEYGRHYTFSPDDFPEWATLARLQQSFNEEDGTLADASDRLSGAVQDARRRFAEALNAVGG